MSTPSPPEGESGGGPLGRREDTFTLSTDPSFIDEVRDVVGLPMSPLERVVVLFKDENQVQALDRTQPIFHLL